ncbi:MAG: CoA pyrophosphatase [Gudongella sp.]|jgi:8-oxo-dGTP pyrophosphatase MutT (NUDIX family)|nr:CoA pyrophosphatase [Gudongella sp.]
MDINKLAMTVQNKVPKPMDIRGEFAVLIPLIDIGGKWEIIYEVRSNNIAQPGEVSFPGGGVEEGESFKQAAIRETMEELRIERRNINLIGELDFLVSHAGFTIHCFLGIIMNIDFPKINPNPDEVDHLFTVPIDFLIENEPLEHELLMKTEESESFPYHLIPNGKDYNFRVGRHKVLFYEYDGHTIWGFTARMTRQLIELIKET